MLSESPLKTQPKFTVRDGLGEVINGAMPKRLDGRFDRAVPGEHDDADPQVSAKNLAQEVRAAHTRERNIAYREGERHLGVRARMVQEPTRFHRGRSDRWNKPLLAQEVREALRDHRIVVNHQHPRRACWCRTRGGHG